MNIHDTQPTEQAGVAPSGRKQRRPSKAPRPPETSSEVKIPIAEDIERSLLGLFAMWCEGEKDGKKNEPFARALEAGLSREHFYIPSNKTIFNAMFAINLNRGEIHPITVMDYLRTQHKLDEVGGPAYIARLMEEKPFGPTALSSLIEHLSTVRFKREAFIKAVKLQDMAANGSSPVDIEELLDSFERTNLTPQTYIASPAGLMRRKLGLYGQAEPEKLTNFNAKIVQEQIEDDGSLEETRIFELECEIKGQKATIRVPASKYSTMAWPTAMLGAEAIVYPGKEAHARAAIQMLSRNIRKITVYTHTGWRQIDGVWSYLHSGGALTPTGNRTDVSVRLPESLRFYLLPEPTMEKEQRAEVFNAVLKLMNAFPRTLTVPLIGGVWASVLGGIDYSIYVTGQSGTRKSEITSLMQAFFGAGFNRLALPSSFVDSALAILLKAFRAKDAVMVIDDFAPNGQKNHDDKLHTTAETVFRAAGNAAGRTTAKVDHSERGAKPPRGMLFSSGEDVPRGLSLQNRLLIVPLKLGDIPDEPLTEMQALARAGKFAESMAAFIQHVATFKKTIARLFAADCVLYRQRIAAGNKQHSRQPTTIAHLCASWRAWLRCGVMAGAFNRAEARLLWSKIYEALTATLEEQKEQHTTTHPADYFLDLLRSALVSGRCHLATIEGDKPSENAALLGWRGGVAQGELAGWIEDGLIYLEPAAAYKAANAQGLSVGEGLPVGPKSLWTRLDEKKYVVVKENGRGVRARTPRTRLYCVVIPETAVFN